METDSRVRQPSDEPVAKVPQPSAPARIRPATVLGGLVALGFWLTAIRVAWISRQVSPWLVLGVLIGTTAILVWLWRDRRHGVLVAVLLTPVMALVALLVATLV